MSVPAPNDLDHLDKEELSQRLRVQQLGRTYSSISRKSIFGNIIEERSLQKPGAVLEMA